MTKNKELLLKTKVNSKLILPNMDFLIHDDAPMLMWDGKLCKKKVIYAHELYELLNLDKKSRSRTISRWLSMGIEGGSHFCMRADVKSNRRTEKINSAYLRIEFAKTICMSVKTPEAQAVREYLIKETRALYDMHQRQQLAIGTEYNLSPNLQNIVKNAVELALKQAQIEFEKQHRDQIIAIESKNTLALADLRAESKEFFQKENLRGEINNMVRKYCYQTGKNYRDVWDLIYYSFKIRHKTCDWYYAFCAATNKIDFLCDNCDKKYMRELYNIAKAVTI